MNILFWNLNKNNIKENLVKCLIENNVDIAVLSETNGLDKNFMEEFTQYSLAESNGGCDKIQVIIKNNIHAKVIQEASRYAIYYINFLEKEYILTGLHLQDRRNYPEPDVRKETIGRIINDIKNAENRRKCKDSIIIGDFNANPYDPELMGANAFNAVLFKDIIKKNESRSYQGVSYRYFYNPIINYLGEEYFYGSYYNRNGMCTPIWHCLDQVIVSKNLVDNIEHLEYIHTIGKTSLIKDVKPNKDISDHLPLLVSIN